MWQRSTVWSRGGKRETPAHSSASGSCCLSCREPDAGGPDCATSVHVCISACFIWLISHCNFQFHAVMVQCEFSREWYMFAVSLHIHPLRACCQPGRIYACCGVDINHGKSHHRWSVKSPLVKWVHVILKTIVFSIKFQESWKQLTIRGQSTTVPP